MKANPLSMIEDDWDAVVENYGLDEDSNRKKSTPVLQENACLRIIKTKYQKEAAKVTNPLASQNQECQVELNYSLKIHLMYNQSMHADILTNSRNFN